MWWSSSSGKIELQITKHQAMQAAHSGQCDDDVLELSEVPAISKQLDKLNPATVAEELSGWGAWDDEELTDHKQNLQRLLWLACNDINEGNI